MPEQSTVDATPEDRYSGADLYIGTHVRVFLTSGVALSGTLTRRVGKFLHITCGDKVGTANLDHVVSITNR